MSFAFPCVYGAQSSPMRCTRRRGLDTNWEPESITLVHKPTTNLCIMLGVRLSDAHVCLTQFGIDVED